MIKPNWLYVCLIFIVFSSCMDEDAEPLHSPPKFMEVPRGFDDIPVPDENQFTQARWELGKKLFYDPVMSLDSSISCGACHKPELAFSDDTAFSLGVEDRIGTRNSPSLANVAFHPYYTREGGVPTLEIQVLVPIQEHNEFDFNIVLIADRLSKDSAYVAMSLQAYDRTPDAYVITRALSCFERSLISGYSPYDHYISYDDPKALKDNEIRGMDLFFSDKTNCFQCHSGFNLTDYSFENNGLYLEYTDVGRYRLTGDEADIARFKTPSLRNIELTAPYMHDGSVLTLEDVVTHYNSGGKNHPHKNPLIKPLGLSVSERNDLVSFLKSLTDESFVNNDLFKK